MKHLRKIVSILLTAIMVLAMCIPVMADGINGYTITINNSISGHTYQAYQIFSGKLSTNSQNQKVLSVERNKLKDYHLLYMQLYKLLL